MHNWSWACLSPCFAESPSVAALEASVIVAYGRKEVRSHTG